jgi:DNA-binding PadR family transcriptional regulator
MRHVAPQHVEDKPKPLTEAVFLILLSLATQPRHGYALLKDTHILSGGRVELTTGTLYGALQRLLVDGWIERFDQEDTARDKQSYRLTKVGLKHLHFDLDRMRQMTKIAGTRLRSVGT